MVNTIWGNSRYSCFNSW